MCGLITILDWDAGGWGSSLEATRAVNRGLKQMHYRGLPGRSLVIQQGKTILGHTRLPIISMAEEFDQPMEREGIIGAFVGEIFNYQGWETESDTEAMLHVFNHYGERGFHNFDGFWASVFIQKEEVTVVTDYLSQKPLYWNEGTLLVASEPMALVAALDQELELDPVYFANVLKWGYSPDHRTPWKAIQQLPAGMALSYPSGPTLTPYWDWSKVPRENDLKAALVQATRNRLVGDREVAHLLSGGLDSTIIYEILTKELGQVVHPYYIFNEDEDDKYINNVTQDYFSLKPTSVDIKEAVKAHQVPVDLGSMLPQLELAQALRQRNYYVCMSGDGADELFGGYRRAKDYDSQASDVFMELPFYHLPRLDRLMMNQTVELRTPYLAPQVIKLALELPWEVRTQKEYLKAKFKDLVPQKILDRPKHPLKSPQVIQGGVEYRKELIAIWKSLYDVN
jgi:asparagine synthase (glutamine-hydrolysing)